MSTYVLTGGATGIGAAVKTQLTEAGHRVVTIDIKDGDYSADLGSADSRAQVIADIDRDLETVDGLITCAGVASHFPDLAKILAINFWGTKELIEGLAHKIPRGGRIVAISSNSAPMCSKPELVQSMMDDDQATAMTLAANSSGHDCYSGSKQAVARWMRLKAPEYARKGISFNAVAPGYIDTPMTQAVAKDETYGDAIRQFVASIPLGRPGQPEDIAYLVTFLLSPGASFIAGSLIFADGAHDAMFRPEAWG